MAVLYVLSLAAVFSVVTRDDNKNGCEGDYSVYGFFVLAEGNIPSLDPL